MTNLKEQIHAEIQHHISPLIGWLRRDASIGKVDNEGERLGQWDDRAERAAKAIAELVGESEYEYAVEWTVKGSDAPVPLKEGSWTPKDTALRYLEFNEKMFPDKMEKYTVRLVKRRKAGPVEDV